MKLLLVRHGQTAFNLEHRYLGALDPPLNDTGIAQAQKMLSATMESLSQENLATSAIQRAIESSKRHEDQNSPVLATMESKSNLMQLEKLVTINTGISTAKPIYYNWTKK